MKFKQVGVIGAGVMGVGVTQNLIEKGCQVILVDLTEERLQAALKEIQANMRMMNFFRKDKKKAATLELVEATTDYRALAKADFVIENVTENWPTKRSVYVEIDPICPDHCVFAVNTSAISITRVGSVTNRADRVVGMHFMNPVPLKPTVEVIRGHHTSEATIARAREILALMGKEGIVVNDMPGFVSNRVLMLTINEAVFLVQDQVASAEDVDRIFKTCFGHKMGPLETGDLIGLDTILLSLEVLYESYNDDKYRPSPLLKKMVHAGLWGRKSGRGFYNYTSDLAEKQHGSESQDQELPVAVLS